MENNRLRVIKRNGRTVYYNTNRIRYAVRQAWDSTRETLIDNATLRGIVSLIDNEIHKRYAENDYTVEILEIDNIVERTLNLLGHTDITHHYVNYRLKKDELRNEAINVDAQVGKLLNKDATVINENANKNAEVFHTQRDLLAGSVSKAKGLAMLPKRIADAHQHGKIHFHDLDYSLLPMHNCSLPDFNGMLKNGFVLGNAHVETPKSIGTASTVLSQIILAVASSQYGGISVDSIDLLLEPYAERSYKKNIRSNLVKIAELDEVELTEDEVDIIVEKIATEGSLDFTDNKISSARLDKIKEFAKKETTKQIYDAMQTLEFQNNTVFSTQGQTPFITVGFGLGTSWMAREIQKSILEIRIQGLGAEKRTAIFPKLVFVIKKGHNDKPGTPNYDIKKLALKCSSERMYPDIVSYENIVKVTGSFKFPMGCRSFLQSFKDENGEEVTVGRLNLGVVTLNLPRIALETYDDMNAFWALLDERLELCHEALRFRENWVRTAQPKNAPILYMHGALGNRLEPSDDTGKLFDNGRATISLGYIGLYEVARLFYGKDWERNPVAKKFTLDIIRHMKKRTEEWNQQAIDDKGTLGSWISVYSTPSESLTDRLARLDLQKFGKIEDITVKPDGTYYINSFHLDPRHGAHDGWDPFQKIDFEADYPLAGASGGFITYVEFPNVRQNLTALEAVWDYAMEKIAYFGTNTPIDRCFKCEFKGDFIADINGYKCPECGNDDPEFADVSKRVCGYLGSPLLRPAVAGRAAETRSRKKHC